MSQHSIAAPSSRTPTLRPRPPLPLPSLAECRTLTPHFAIGNRLTFDARWQPVRSPEAIAAEAAAAEAQAAAEEENRRIRQVIARAEQAVDQAEQFLRETAAAAADGGDGNEDAAAEQVADANPPPNVD